MQNIADEVGVPSILGFQLQYLSELKEIGFVLLYTETSSAQSFNIFFSCLSGSSPNRDCFLFRWRGAFCRKLVGNLLAQPTYKWAIRPRNTHQSVSYSYHLK